MKERTPLLCKLRLHRWGAWTETLRGPLRWCKRCGHHNRTIEARRWTRSPLR